MIKDIKIIVQERSFFPFVLLTFVGLFIVYLPLWKAGFIWDDDRYILENPHMRTLAGLGDIWTSTSNDVHYWPVTLSLWWLQVKFWGFQALGFHLFNIAFQGVNTIFLYLLLRLWNIPLAWWVALVFALHPLNVETVAWITELKNLASGLLAILTLGSFVEFLKTEQKNWWWLSAILFTFAMLAKSSTVILPVMCLLLVFHFRAKDYQKFCLATVPYFIFALAISALFILKEHEYQQEAYFDLNLDFAQRLIIASKAVWFYLAKIFVPYPLMTIYPAFDLNVSHLSNWLPLLGLLILWLYLYFLWRKKVVIPALLGAFFVAALLPILGFVNHRMLPYSQVADHYQYLASPAIFVGVALLLAAYTGKNAPLADTKRKSPKPPKVNIAVPFPLSTPMRLALGGILVILGVISHQQSKIYYTSKTLWQDTTDKNPTSFFGLWSLGYAFMQENNYPQAINYFTESLKFKVNYGAPLINRGIAYNALQNYTQAVDDFTRASKVQPNNAIIYSNRGVTLLNLNRHAEALVDFNKAILLNPKYSGAYSNRAFVHLIDKRYDQSLQDYNQAIVLNPMADKAYFYRGVLYNLQNETALALADFNQTLNLNPDFLEVYLERSDLQIKMGKKEQALADINLALARNPNFAEGYSKRGIYYFNQLQDATKACLDLQKACQLLKCDNLNQAKTKGVCLNIP